MPEDFVPAEGRSVVFQLAEGEWRPAQIVKYRSIGSTPVIDRGANALYLIAFLLEDNQPVYRLYALDLVTLADKTPPQLITASVALSDGSKYDFNPKVTRQRAALAISNDNKVVYGAFASFCDHAADKSRGWIMGWDSQTLKPIAAAITDHRPPGGADFFDTWRLASIWMSGYGPAVEGMHRTAGGGGTPLPQG